MNDLEILLQSAILYALEQELKDRDSYSPEELLARMENYYRGWKKSLWPELSCRLLITLN